MTITEFIAELEKFRAEHGDLQVHTEMPWGRCTHSGPVLAHAKVLSGRESRDRFCWTSRDEKGEPLCKL